MGSLRLITVLFLFCSIVSHGQENEKDANESNIRTLVLATPTLLFQDAIIGKSTTPEAYIKSKAGFGGLLSISFLVEQDIRFRAGLGFNQSSFEAYKFSDSVLNINSEVISYNLNQPYLHFSVDHHRTNTAGFFSSIGAQISPVSYVTATSSSDSTLLRSNQGFNTSFFLKVGMTSNQKSVFNGLDFGLVFPMSGVTLQNLANSYSAVRLDFSLHFRMGSRK